MSLRRQFGLFCAVFLLLTALGCASILGNPGTTSIHVTGTPGAQFSADYWRDGERIHASGNLPWDLEGQHLTRVELQKANPADVFTIEAHFSDGKSQAMITKTVNSGIPRATIEVSHGLSIKMSGQ